MATVDENQSFWALYDWSGSGEEWSEGWGGSHAQWYGVVLPRIARFLPASSILEIAPGHGRWTAFLREHCDQLSIVDLDAACIDACRERFAGDERIAYHVNDGRSLDMIEDGSVDFAFSFDSLVHADAEVICRVPARAGEDARSGRGGVRPPFERRPISTLLRARRLDPAWTRCASGSTSCASSTGRAGARST